MARDDIDPAEVRTTLDHLAITRWQELTHPTPCPASKQPVPLRRSTPCAHHSRPQGLYKLMAAFSATGVPVIVTNNAADAAGTYLDRRDLNPYVRDVVGRPSAGRAS